MKKFLIFLKNFSKNFQKYSKNILRIFPKKQSQKQTGVAHVIPFTPLYGDLYNPCVDSLESLVYPYKIHNFDALNILFGFWRRWLECWIFKFELWNNIESCKISAQVLPTFKNHIYHHWFVGSYQIWIFSMWPISQDE